MWLWDGNRNKEQTRSFKTRGINGAVKVIGSIGKGLFGVGVAGSTIGAG